MPGCDKVIENNIVHRINPTSLKHRNYKNFLRQKLNITKHYACQKENHKIISTLTASYTFLTNAVLLMRPLCLW